MIIFFILLFDTYPTDTLTVAALLCLIHIKDICRSDIIYEIA